MERFSYWTNLNSRKPEIWIRYHALRSILLEIESLDFDNLPDFDTTKEFILLAIATSQSLFTRDIKSNEAIEALTEERGIVASLIEEWNSNEKVEPLFYRHSLSQQEISIYWARLVERFDISKGFCWSPIDGIVRPTALIFTVEAFEKAIPPQKLRDILASHGINRVLELRENSEDCWLDLSEFEAYYNMAEGFWSSQSLDWIIYASHESSISIGGWLSTEIKQAWPDWETGVWTTP